MSGGSGTPSSTGLELFVDDVPMTIARYPNHGFIKIAEALGPTPVAMRGHKGTKEGIFRVDDPRVARWAAESDPRVFGYWFWDWVDQRQKIASIDPRKLVLTLAPPWHGYGYAAGGYFYGFNLLCEIDEPGEWYLDRKTGLLYLLPPGNDVPQRTMVSILPTLMDVAAQLLITLLDLPHLEKSKRDFIFVATRPNPWADIPCVTKPWGCPACGRWR